MEKESRDVYEFNDEKDPHKKIERIIHFLLRNHIATVRIYKHKNKVIEETYLNDEKEEIILEKSIYYL